MPQDRNDNSKQRPDNVKHYPLGEREYKGPNGQTHHHTNVYMERHGNDPNRGCGKGNGRNHGDRGNR
jgi:hypothetical protein